MSVAPASQTVNTSTASVQVEIQIHAASDVGAWEFGLEYDPALVDLIDVAPGPFMADHGIDAHCYRSNFPTHDGRVAVQYGCGSLGQINGATGDGSLATITMKPKAVGIMNLLFVKRELGLPDGSGIPVDSTDGVIKVVEPGSDTSLAPTPTPNALLLTPTALPAREDDPFVRRDSGSGSTDTTGSGGSSASGSAPPAGQPAGNNNAGANSAVAGAVTGLPAGSASASGSTSPGGDFPRAGTGPERRSSNGTMIIVVTSMFVVGLLLLVLGAAERERAAARRR